MTDLAYKTRRPATQRRAEASLLRPTIIGLLRLRWLHQMTRADTEVQWKGKRIDFAFMSAQDGVGPVAIELKVNSTKRAIDQAVLNRFLTPHSWVATYTAPSLATRERAERQGVGLMLVVEHGVYPVLHPAPGEPRTDALAAHFALNQRRVRDILSELRRG